MTTITTMTRSLRDYFFFDPDILNGSSTTMSMATTPSTTPFVGRMMKTTTTTTTTTTPTIATFAYDQNAIVTNILWDLYDSFNDVQPNYLLITLYVPIIALAVTANALVIAVVFKYHYMRSVTNYFVVNLSVADLLVTMICMPVAVTQAVSLVWIYGEVMCKLSSYLQGVAVAASVYTITAMSIDRYLAIRSPIAFRRVFNRRSTVVVIVILWLIALSIFVPILQGMTLQSPGTEVVNITLHGSWALKENFSRNDTRASRLPPAFYICSEDLNPLGIDADLFGTACFILVYAIPGFVVILAYSMMGRTLCARKPPFDCDSVKGSASSQQNFRLVRERRRIAWILLLLAVLFALCWLPYNVLRLLVDLKVVDKGKSVSDALSYCLFIGHANSALNPVVYCFMTRNFRRSVAEILRRRSRGLTRRKPRHKDIHRGMGDACGGCSMVGETKRGFLRQRRMPICCIPMGADEIATSSGYNSFYSKQSLHRRCYMLRSLRGTPQMQIEAKPVDVIGDSHPSYNKNDAEASQPRQSTLVTMDDRRCT
ncbi:RYamide receptor-like [Polistes fuscatus]|uniref:RYamide receptor-like n=1 Tax=Polistes fuscatus TaxID=30207 RepID=UPI001CA94AEE|nr:RYamide receptor-like [Polistes fuscatus]XP_043490067.1 RYamide receptor-like [Polistes fuscatus]XP_043490068.1 RYamide receptor-like [Polistes fuscatus]XP_043490069.1 RYamide receptor-like [Polistes fuscatus]XP_043490070.1 RYamide receptor-like [Polistes fuscatus]